MYYNYSDYSDDWCKQNSWYQGYYPGQQKTQQDQQNYQYPQQEQESYQPGNPNTRNILPIKETTRTK
jgi:hypothetical protein